MELERREHDTFTMSRLSNVNFSSLLTTSKFTCLKVFSLHCARLVPFRSLAGLALYRASKYWRLWVYWVALVSLVHSFALGEMITSPIRIDISP